MGEAAEPVGATGGASWTVGGAVSEAVGGALGETVG